MLVSKKRLYTIWLFILMLSVIWQDFFLSDYLGRIASTPIFTLLPILVLFELVVFVKKRNWASIGGEVTNIFITLLILFLVVSGIYLIFFTAKMDLNILGENVYVKTIKQSAYYVMIILFVRNLAYTINRIDSIQVISNVSFYIICIFLVIILGELVELNKEWVYPNKPLAWPSLHSIKTDNYWYVRLLTSESSYTGPMVVFFSILTLLKLPVAYSKRFFRYSILSLFLILYVFNTHSKGFFTCIIFSILFLFFFKMNKKYLGVIFVSLSVILIFFSVNFLTKDALLTASASIMTRYTGLMSGVYSLIFNPIGTGGLNYVFVLDYLQEVGQYSELLLGEYADSKEINRLVEKADDKNLGIKSTLGHWAITFGIFGIAIYTFMCYKLVSYNKNSQMLLFGAFFFISMTFFVTPIEMEYPSIMFLVVSRYIYLKNKKQVINES